MAKAYQTIFVAIAYYHDGSGEPQVLRAYDNKIDADSDMAMLETCGTHMAVQLVEVKMLIGGDQWRAN
jgi:hypothetical protein